MSVIGKKYRQGLNEYIACRVNGMYCLIDVNTGSCYSDGLDFNSFMKLLEEDCFIEL